MTSPVPATKVPIRVLLLEDERTDAELTLRELKRAGLRIQTRVASSEDGFRKELAEFMPEVILSDFAMPGFDGMFALTLARDLCPEVPFIFVSGTIGEEYAIRALQTGATDYVLKTNLARLPAAVERALQDVKRRAALRAAEQEFRESESLKAAILEASLDCVVTADREGRVVEFNPAAEVTFGIEREQALGVSIAELIIPPRLRDAHRSGFARYLATGESRILGRRIEMEAMRGDGTEFPIELTIAAIRTGSQPLFAAFIRDLSERKRTEENLRRFRLALDKSADIILLIDRATMNHVDANETACKMLGYSREELLRMGPQDTLPVSRADLEKAYDELIASPLQSGSLRSYYRCKDGSRLPFESSRHVLRSGDSWLIAVISRDIRERMAAESSLRMSEERHRAMFERAAVGISHTDLDGRILMVNPKMCEMSGFTQDEVLALTIRDLTHPDDIQTSRKYREQLLGGGSAPIEREARALRKDGSYFWANITTSLVRAADGQPSYFISILHDISERKRAEFDLQRFRMAMDVSTDSIYLTDPATMRFVYLNNTACERLGHPRERLLKMGPQDVLPIGLEQIRREYSEVMAASDRGLVYERQFARNDGSEGWTELHRRALNTDGGMLMVTIGRDITERKQADDRIRRLNRVYAMLSGINALIVRVRDRYALFDGACRIAVEQAGFPLAWIGTLDVDSQELKPAAMAGTVLEYAKVLQPSVRADIPAGQGTNGRAFRERKPIVENDMAANPNAGSRRNEGLKYGIRSAMSLPLLVGGMPVGVLALYAKEKDYFDDEEVKLLTGLASDISFALDHLEKAERLTVEAAQRLRAEEKVVHLNRVYAMLSGINTAIVRVQSKEDLFREACRVAVEQGQFQMAWLGTVDRQAMRITPVAWQGAGSEYIEKMPLGMDDSGPEGRGLAGRAVREGKVVVVDDMTQDPRVLLKKEATERGFHSLVMLPLIVSEQAVGVLALYASEIGFFDEEEMKLLRELAGDIAFALDHIEKKEKLDYLAYYDQLTGLANRALFLERASQSIQAAGRADGKLAFAILDIERLRTINESLGRQAGDVLIKLVAERLIAVGGPSGVSRISADHFALVLGTVKGRSEAGRLVTDALRKCFDGPFQVADTELRIAAKAGVALFPGDGSEAEVLLRNAEAALRRGKDGGEQITFHAAEMTARMAENLTLENKLRQALEKQEFVLHYQPKVDIETRRMLGTEALIRWNSPERGLVPPGHFIPLLEETGLILQVGAWALERAVLDHGHWLRQGVAAPRIAVNVSAIQLRQRDFVEVVKEVISRGASPTAIDLEITESLLMEDVAGNIKKLKALRDLGMKISIDDFGTGYSSLGYLAKLPVHTLKIDRSFIVSMLNDPDTMTLVSTIISLAHSLRLTVVAEGVEHEEQAKMLRLLRCDELQGYLFSKPVPFEQLTALLAPGAKS